MIAELGDNVFTSKDELYSVSYDGLKVKGNPDALIKIHSSEDVGKCLSLANEFCVPVTCRGSGSSLTGGATPFQGGWVLDLSSLDRIEIDKPNRLARCGPGAVVSNLQEQAAHYGLFYPPDPSSKDFCTIGGNVACNAGGLRCVKYGVTLSLIHI